MRLAASGKLLWQWASGHRFDDVANSVVQLPGGGDIIIAGYRNISGVARRTLTKLSIATGSELWTAVFEDDAKASTKHTNR